METRTLPPLIDVASLAARAGDPGLRIIDLRWTLGGVPQAEKYARGHIPGAVLVLMEGELSRPGEGPGRHPLPPVADFAALLARIGVGERTQVVVYDDATGSFAARLWFMLRLHGHSRASVLDGGYSAWEEAGLPVEAGEQERPPAAPLRQLVRDEAMLADKAEVERLMAARTQPGPRTLLLDARAQERYRGEVEPIDKRAGHIPGAVNAPFAENLAAGHFRSPDELRARYEALGANTAAQVIASCGSGVTACHALLALAVAGLPGGRLYVGSWSEWSSDPAAPIATGPAPG